MNQWVDVRCRGCHRLLFKATAGALVGTVQIKCPRCADVNQVGLNRIGYSQAGQNSVPETSIVLFVTGGPVLTTKKISDESDRPIMEVRKWEPEPGAIQSGRIQDGAVVMDEFGIPFVPNRSDNG